MFTFNLDTKLQGMVPSDLQILLCIVLVPNEIAQITVRIIKSFDEVAVELGWHPNDCCLWVSCWVLLLSLPVPETPDMIEDDLSNDVIHSTSGRNTGVLEGGTQITMYLQAESDSVLPFSNMKQHHLSLLVLPPHTHFSVSFGSLGDPLFHSPHT